MLTEQRDFDTLDLTTEADRLRGAIIDLLGTNALSYREIAAGLREDWGPATPAQIRESLRGLVKHCAAVRTIDEDGRFRYRLKALESEDEAL